MDTTFDVEVLPLQTVSDLLMDVICEENITDPKLHISSGSEKGDGFTSIMTKVLITEKNKKLSLIIKCAQKNPIARDALPSRQMFLREIKYYQEILPAFKQLQIEKCPNNAFDSTAICYKTSDLDKNELLVLEDLNAKNFKLFPRQEQMNDAHIEMVLNTYAHLHALSFAMKEHSPDCFEKLTENMNYLVTQKHMSKAVEILYDGSQKIRNLFDKGTEPEMFNYFEDLDDAIVPFFDLLENYHGNDGVFIHGDSWCNNMMFQYKENDSTTPTDIRLLDFQLGSLMPAAIDVIYFFYVSASQKMMDNLEYYQQIYHHHLSDHMKEMGCNVENHYPFSMFKNDWKKYAKLGLYFSTCIYRLRFQGDDEILDFSDASPKDALMKSSKFDDIINRKYKDIALHFYKNKF